MADVLPSCIGMEGLLYLLFSGFVQANKSHGAVGFDLACATCWLESHCKVGITSLPDQDIMVKHRPWKTLISL